MVFYAAFNGILVISRQRLHCSCLSWVSPVLDWVSELSWPRTLPRKTQSVHCSSNPRPLECESNTLPLSHTGSLIFIIYRVENILDKGYDAGYQYFRLLQHSAILNNKSRLYLDHTEKPGLDWTWIDLDLQIHLSFVLANIIHIFFSLNNQL